MLKLNPDQHRSPIGGHQFPTHGITFTADDFQTLSKKVYEFRVTNMLPAGDPDQEILRYYLEKWPYMVSIDEKAVKSKSSNYFDLWARWVGRAWRNPPKSIVTTKEAADRLETCLGCPHNKPLDWKKTPETESLSQRTFLLRRGYEVSPKIGFCTRHKADISVFCFLATPDAFSEIESQAEPQASCWVSSLKGP
jgi:hypothetical protein